MTATWSWPRLTRLDQLWLDERRRPLGPQGDLSQAGPLLGIEQLPQRLLGQLLQIRKPCGERLGVEAEAVRAGAGVFRLLLPFAAGGLDLLLGLLGLLAQGTDLGLLLRSQCQLLLNGREPQQGQFQRLARPGESQVVLSQSDELLTHDRRSGEMAPGGVGNPRTQVLEIEAFGLKTPGKRPLSTLVHGLQWRGTADGGRRRAPSPRPSVE